MLLAPGGYSACKIYMKFLSVAISFSNVILLYIRTLPRAVVPLFSKSNRTEFD